MSYLNNLAAIAIGKEFSVEPNFIVSNNINNIKTDTLTEKETAYPKTDIIHDKKVNKISSDNKYENSISQKTVNRDSPIQQETNENEFEMNNSFDSEQDALQNIEDKTTFEKGFDDNDGVNTKIDGKEIISLQELTIKLKKEDESTLNIDDKVYQEKDPDIHVKNEKVTGLQKSLKISGRNNFSYPIPDKEDKAEEPSTINISIGRIEVKAVHPEKKINVKSGQKPQLSLNDYLKSFNRDKR